MVKHKLELFKHTACWSGRKLSDSSCDALRIVIQVIFAHINHQALSSKFTATLDQTRNTGIPLLGQWQSLITFWLTIIVVQIASYMSFLFPRWYFPNVCIFKCHIYTLKWIANAWFVGCELRDTKLAGIFHTKLKTVKSTVRSANIDWKWIPQT